MTRPVDWVPLRWPAEWKPEALALLEKTPFNCLVVNDADRTALAPVLEKATSRGIAAVSLGEGGKPNTIAAAPLAKITGKEPGDVLALADAVWPRIPARGSTGFESGPTGLPWVDSNGWTIRLLRAKDPKRVIWVDSKLPEKVVMRPENYVLAVSDPGAYGARWVATLDNDTAKQIQDGTDKGKLTWQNIVDATAFFEKQKAWREYQAVAALGIASDFTGSNEYIGTETLNLTARRQLQYRILYTPRMTAANLHGMKGLLWANEAAPEGTLADAVKSFVASGGTLVAPPAMAAWTKGLASAGEYGGRYNIYKSGAGKIAVAKEAWDDPYQVAADTHMILSRRNDVLRVWNSAAINAYYSAGANGKAVVHILNYATRSFGSPVSLYVSKPYKTVKWATLPAEVPEDPPVTRKAPGIEVAVPPFEAYGVIELGD